MNKLELQGKSILVTGGTGSFGKHFVKTVLQGSKPRRLIIYSRDELKQWEMSQEFSQTDYPCMRYFIGDVRDAHRLNIAMRDVDVVVHAAALKHVPAAEYNPTECIATNVMGAQNVIDGAISNGITKVIALSTDKAANPINLYGATKLCSDKLFISANNLSGRQKTRFSVVRYGNVIGSRGSVIPVFKRMLAQGMREFPITDPAMTRFVITLEQGVDFVLDCLMNMVGGELFVPKLPSIKIVDVISALGEGMTYKVIGIRPGEKLHEIMIPWDESRNCVDMGRHYVVEPQHHWWNIDNFSDQIRAKGKRITECFEYASNTNTDWVAPDRLKQLVAAVPAY